MEEIFTLYGEPCDIIVKIVLTLLEELPLKYLLKTTSIECIVDKLRTVVACVDKNKLMDAITTIHSPYVKDIKKLLDTILTEVFGSGLDYLYIIPDK